MSVLRTMRAYFDYAYFGGVAVYWAPLVLGLTVLMDGGSTSTHPFTPPVWSFAALLMMFPAQRASQLPIRKLHRLFVRFAVSMTIFAVAEVSFRVRDAFAPHDAHDLLRHPRMSALVSVFMMLIVVLLPVATEELYGVRRASKWLVQTASVPILLYIGVLARAYVSIWGIAWGMTAFLLAAFVYDAHRVGAVIERVTFQIARASPFELLRRHKLATKTSFLYVIWLRPVVVFCTWTFGSWLLFDDGHPSPWVRSFTLLQSCAVTAGVTSTVQNLASLVQRMPFDAIRAVVSRSAFAGILVGSAYATFVWVGGAFGARSVVVALACAVTITTITVRSFSRGLSMYQWRFVPVLAVAPIVFVHGAADYGSLLWLSLCLVPPVVLLAYEVRCFGNSWQDPRQLFVSRWYDAPTRHAGS